MTDTERSMNPFLDINGRMARTILDFQTKQLLGHPRSRDG
jgi:hypothetical protein